MSDYPNITDPCPQCGELMDIEAVTFWACEDLNDYDTADLTCTACHIEWWVGHRNTKAVDHTETA